MTKQHKKIGYYKPNYLKTFNNFRNIRLSYNGDLEVYAQLLATNVLQPNQLYYQEIQVINGIYHRIGFCTQDFNYRHRALGQTRNSWGL